MHESWFLDAGVKIAVRDAHLTPSLALSPLQTRALENQTFARLPGLRKQGSHYHMITSPHFTTSDATAPLFFPARAWNYQVSEATKLSDSQTLSPPSIILHHIDDCIFQAS